MFRAAALERQEMPEHDKRARTSQLRQYHGRTRQCRRRQVATAWRLMSREPMGELAEIGEGLLAIGGAHLRSPPAGRHGR